MLSSDIGLPPLRIVASLLQESKTGSDGRATAIPLLQHLGMPGIPTNLWGESPLYENELPLRKGSIPNVNLRENKY